MIESSQDLQQGAFADARSTGNGAGFTAGDLELHTIEYDGATKGTRQTIGSYLHVWQASRIGDIVDCRPWDWTRQTWVLASAAWTMGRTTMPLADDLKTLQSDGTAQLSTADDTQALEQVRIDLLGRNGRLKELSKAFKQAPPEQKRELGQLLSAVTQTLRETFEERQQQLAFAGEADPIDISEPRPRHVCGSIHPISRVAWEVEQVFSSMGFDVVDGPHVEEDEYNFGRLNIPADHPARDAQDTFWLSTGKLLRTHTSSVQARTYPVAELPLRRVVVGKVFRYEEVDATHDNTFTQVEGFIVDEGITVGHLIGTLQTMIRGVLHRDDVEVRLRPSFFPFVEPGFEVDVRSSSATGRFANWVELLGCGMIHPNVLRAGGIDADRYTGFAFGLGLERLTMIRHGIDDIRLFNGSDLRGLRQFDRS